MSDRVKTDNKYFLEKFKLELKRVNRSLSGLYKLANDRGAKKTDDKMQYLFYQAGSLTNKYSGGMYHTIDSIRSAKRILEKDSKKNRIEKQKELAESRFRSEFGQRIHNDYRINIEVNMTNDGCGRFDDPERYVIPIMYPKIVSEIGVLSANKVLVYAKPHHHDVFKCWRAQFYTFTRAHGRRIYRSVDCFIMKDVNSGTTYYHTDYRLCADGMRRAIGRKVAKRMGGL